MLGLVGISKKKIKKDKGESKISPFLFEENLNFPCTSQKSYLYLSNK